MRGNGAASVTPASPSRHLPVTQHTGRNWLNAETVESREGVRYRPACSSTDHDAVDGGSLGKHDLIVRFLRGARRLNPSRPPLMPSWDLSIVLAGLQRGPFEPLDSVELKYLSAKTALLTALTSIKRVGDLQAFSVREECLVFGPDYSHVVLRPRPGYVPNVPTTPFRDQVVNLQGGGRPSLGVAVSRKSIAHIRGPHPELQKL